MKTKKAISWWAALSPICWMCMLFVSLFGKIGNVWLSAIIAFITLGSVFASAIAAMRMTEDENFFKSMDELSNEIEAYQKIRRKYERLIEDAALKAE